MVTYDSDGERTAGLILSADEAFNNFGISADDLYEPTEVSTLKNIIAKNGGKSSEGDPSKVETYVSGDYVMDNNDFRGMTGNSKYDVRVNFSYFNGKYFPHVYVYDGVNAPKVKDLPGIPNLQDAMVTLQNYMDPQFAQNILISASK